MKQELIINYCLKRHLVSKGSSSWAKDKKIKTFSIFCINMTKPDKLEAVFIEKCCSYLANSCAWMMRTLFNSILMNSQIISKIFILCIQEKN